VKKEKKPPFHAPSRIKKNEEKTHAPLRPSKVNKSNKKLPNNKKKTKSEKIKPMSFSPNFKSTNK
jgi:hypothetical protein